MIKSRYLSRTLVTKSNQKHGRIIVLTDARQTGKTTMAGLCFPEFQYISIEDPLTRDAYTGLTSKQWESNYPFAILDEVQKAPSLIESIKAVFDQFDKTKYILLGSSQFLLLQQVKESLAGRCAIYDLMPLTLPEMLTESWDQEIKPSFFMRCCQGNCEPPPVNSFLLHPDYDKVFSIFDHYLNFGGYPAVVDPEISESERWEWLYNYIRTFLERDLRDLVELRNLEQFLRMQKTTALLTGTMVNYSQLAREADISPDTAKRFLNYLELSYQIVLIKPWARNKLKRLSKSPKLHYLDPGIQRGILRKRGALSGNEFESAVIAEIYKQTKLPWSNIDLYHLRTVDGKEVDLLIELEHGYIALEVKIATNISKTDTKNFRGLEEILDKPLLMSFILSNDTNIKQFGENVLAMPAAMFLS